MIRSKQFWKDIELAVNIMMLRQRIRHITSESRNTRTDFNKGFLTTPGHDRILDRYRILTMVRFRSHTGHLYA